MQNKVTQRVVAFLSEEWGNQISFDKIQIAWFNRVTITDFCVTDLRQDTILFAPELIARLNFLAFSSREVQIRKVALNQANIHLAIDPERDEINIKFIIDRLKSQDTTQNKERWLFGIKTIELNDCHFAFTNEMKAFSRPFGMDYADIDVSHLNLQVTNFRQGDPDEGGVRFRINKLACIEKCGLTVNLFKADFFVNRNNLSFKNVQIDTPESSIKANDASFLFDSFKEFADGHFPSNVQMSIDVRSSFVTSKELAYFVPAFADYADTISVAGKVLGTVDNFKAENLDLKAGQITHLQANLDLKGLPQLRTTLIYADVKELTSCPSDIERIKVARSRTGHVNLPVSMHKFTAITYKGNFTGFFDDFVAYGTFATNLGNLSTDVSIKPVADSNVDTTFTFHGELKTEDFHLGHLLTQPSLGTVTLNGMVDGSASGRGNIQATIQGIVESIHVKEYDYRNIDVNGAINNRTYDGQLSIDEPNIKVDFSGKVDLTNAIPEFDFWANVERARLYNLKLNQTDTSAFAAFGIQAVFAGNNIDNLKGELQLKNSLIRRKSKEIEINDLLIFTKEINDTNRFILRSDIFDAEIWGQYQFLQLPQSFLSMVNLYAPAWVPDAWKSDSLSNNDFKFEAEFKNTEKLTNFFVNEFHISKQTRLEGVYNPAQRNVHFSLSIPQLIFDGRRLQNLYISGNTEDSVFYMESGIQTLQLNKNISFENFTILTKTYNDNVDLDFRWNNWDTLVNRGTLSSKVHFTKVPKRSVPLTEIQSEPGRIFLSGDRWDITHNGIVIDSSSVHIRDFIAKKDKQELSFSGVISHREEDQLLVKIKDVNLNVLNSSLQFDKLLFGGIVNGAATISNLYQVPVFISDLNIDDFSLNDALFGGTHIRASWNNFSRSVFIQAESLLNDLRTLHIRGNYYIANSALDFNVDIEKTPLKIFQPYVAAVFSGLDGILSSQMKLTGSITQPVLNGDIEFQRVGLVVNYTQVKYNFSGNAQMKDNAILLKNIQIFDRFGNLCQANGTIKTNYFKNIDLDLQIGGTSFEVLNTTERDNNLFYGKAFASGLIRINGMPKNLRFDITARTSKGTEFNIPLTSSEEVGKSSFLTFVDHSENPARRRYFSFLRNDAKEEVQNEENKIRVNLTLDITPDAEARLIFDSKVGDILRGRGSGNLMINVDPNRFNMAGTYTIESGDYLFTLRNVINKRFSIEKGGTITWNGDPTNALINIKAIYNARPSLYELMDRDERFRRSVPAECIIMLTNRLSDPNIRFDIQLPNADPEIRSFLAASTKSEEEMTRQFLWLLVTNSFYADQNATAQGQTGSSTSSGLGLITATEFLTNQLSYMLSQFSDDLNIDVTYRPGVEAAGTGQNIGVDLSTDLWNLHAAAEVGGTHYNTTESSSVVGDFTFDIKLNKSGKLRFKAFSRSNERYLFEQSQYTQGIGILFREDFNNFKDLFTKKDVVTPPPPRKEEETKDK